MKQKINVDIEKFTQIFAKEGHINSSYFISTLACLLSDEVRYECAVQFMANDKSTFWSSKEYLQLLDCIPKEKQLSFAIKYLPKYDYHRDKFAEINNIINYFSPNEDRWLITLNFITSESNNSVIQRMIEIMPENYIIKQWEKDNNFLDGLHDCEKRCSKIIHLITDEGICKQLYDTYLHQFGVLENNAKKYDAETLINILSRVSPGLHVSQECYTNMFIQLFKHSDLFDLWKSALQESATSDTAMLWQSMYERFLLSFRHVNKNMFEFIKMSCQSFAEPFLIQNFVAIEIAPWKLIEREYLKVKQQQFKTDASFLLLLKKQSPLFFKSCPKPIIYKIAEETSGFPAQDVVETVQYTYNPN